MIAGVLQMTRSDYRAAAVTDLYSMHRVFCDMFTPTKEKVDNEGLGVLFREIEGGPLARRYLFVADREPVHPGYGTFTVKPVPESLLSHDVYRFDVIVNPVRQDKVTEKRVPVIGREAIAEWFAGKSEKAWGFQVDPSSADVRWTRVERFTKKGNNVTLSRARITGLLRVTDREKFEHAFKHGIGRGKAFGCGLLQIVPV